MCVEAWGEIILQRKMITVSLFECFLQIGFFSLILVEAITNKGLLELMGVTVGKGLNIGF